MASASSITSPLSPESHTTPAISVLMPTYNGERFLRPTIESILNQTFPNFELIIIDDGSTDNTPQILSEFKDTRLTVLTNQQNLGIAAATNRGLAAARGEYIALQDHDDISLPHRLQTQLDFLNTHPEIALVGSAAELIDENGIAYDNYREPENDIELKWEALFRCPIRHTSVVVRRKVICEIGGYSADSTLNVASDYDLLSRIVMRYGVANLDERLVRWRRHPAATSIMHDQDQLRAGEFTSLRNIRALFQNDDRTSVGLDQQYLLEGSRAFLCTPVGLLPGLPPRQIISGLRFLDNIFETFCRNYDVSSCSASRLRKRLNWIWGKHGVALAVRSCWDLRSRIHIALLGMRCFCRVAWEGIK